MAASCRIAVLVLLVLLGLGQALKTDTKTVAAAPTATTVAAAPTATTVAAAPTATTASKATTKTVAATPAAPTKTEEKKTAATPAAPAAPAAPTKTVAATPAAPTKTVAATPAAPAATPEAKADAKARETGKAAYGDDVGVVDVVQRLYSKALEFIHNPGNQIAASIIAIALGSVMLCNGELVFQWVVLFIFGSFVFSTCLISAQAFFPDWGLMWCQVLGLEVAVLATAFAYLAWYPVTLLLGAVVGAWSAQQVLGELVSFNADYTDAKQPAICVVVWTLLVALGTWLMHSEHFTKLIRILSPAFGSALFVSTMSYGVTFLTVEGALKGDVGSLTPSCGADPGCSWISFWNLLTSNRSEDVGLFVGASYNPDIEGAPFANQFLCLDRLFERFWWLVLFFISYKVQGKLRRSREAKVAAGQDGLGEPLVPKPKDELPTK